MIRTTLIALVTLAPLSANATQNWYMLDFSTGRCQVAAEYAAKSHQPAMAAPATLEAAERHLGMWNGTRIYRYDDGQIKAVGVTRSGAGNPTIWFNPNAESCNDQRREAVEDGFLGNPGELK